MLLPVGAGVAYTDLMTISAGWAVDRLHQEPNAGYLENAKAGEENPTGKPWTDHRQIWHEAVF